ncbi:sugar transferase [Pseudomonas veronii]|jgi:lipopolysaccharide/colanic/teichoic acid biosynthesis glycosyltransferase|uniref:sugar transferase n=1 Tax=Pseudomonas veronii TaxID=76761 RepID=UPI001474F1A8|nr:sugar transferase [Pseudomonas veronii]MCT8963093.1 sugar transferase [Pseudomonas veronii]NMX49511.1 sugar transferase [Pseudomonas veronii]
MLKRGFDVFAAFFGLLVLSPFFLLVVLWIKLDSPGPAFFRQVRVGRFGVPFRIHKFRTMSTDSERGGRLTVGKDARVTRSGSFLRRFKIDELPQLIDVMLGKMSLVGPRPEVQEFIDCYEPAVREKVLSVRPGISDRASIEMVDENEILAKYADPRKAYIEVILPIKQAYYLQYVDDHGLLVDIRIIFATLVKVLGR